MLRLSGWTVGYVVANQIALLVVTVLANGDSRRPVRLHERVRLLPTPPRPVRGVAHDDVRPRAGDGRRRAATSTPCASSSPAGFASPIVASCPPPRCTSGSPARSSSRCSSAVRSRPPTRQLVADTLVAFAVGLLPFSVYLFALRAFTSRLDTFTPFWLNCIENAVNIALAFPLYAWLGIPGLALAFSLAYFVGRGAHALGAPPAAARHRRAPRRVHHGPDGAGRRCGRGGDAGSSASRSARRAPASAVLAIDRRRARGRGRVPRDAGAAAGRGAARHARAPSCPNPAREART